MTHRYSLCRCLTCDNERMVHSPKTDMVSWYPATHDNPIVHVCEEPHEDGGRTVTMVLSSRIKEKACELGFDQVGDQPRRQRCGGRATAQQVAQQWISRTDGLDGTDSRETSEHQGCLSRRTIGGVRRHKLLHLPHAIRNGREGKNRALRLGR